MTDDAKREQMLSFSFRDKNISYNAKGDGANV